LLGAWPVEQKKGGDPGIDGTILFRDDPKASKAEQIVTQVGGGTTGVKDVRDLRGVLDREKAAMGVLISLQPPMRDMVAEAVSTGFYEHKTIQQKYPRLQLRTVKELMEGKAIERPSNVAPWKRRSRKPRNPRRSWGIRRSSDCKMGRRWSGLERFLANGRPDPRDYLEVSKLRSRLMQMLILRRQSPPKPHQCDIRATPKPFGRQAVVAPNSHPKAIPKPP
jgi:hypothetical protein